MRRGKRREPPVEAVTVVELGRRKVRGGTLAGVRRWDREGRADWRSSMCVAPESAKRGVGEVVVET